jgi:hypothetical protein
LRHPQGRTYAGLQQVFPDPSGGAGLYAREKAALDGGVDPRGGRASVRSLLPVWLEERKHAVSPKTYVADAALVRLEPATALKRTLRWTTIADGRRIHDLRHTAACLWLARGLDPATVQAWMGHASSSQTGFRDEWS